MPSYRSNSSGGQVTGGVFSLLIRAGCFYLGYRISIFQDPVFVWAGAAVMLFSALSTFKIFFNITNTSLQQAKQYQYSVHAHTPSGNLGNAHLADKNSKVITTLSQNKRGLFLGAYCHLLLFFDPFASGNAHWMIFARARSGKTSCVITPTALSWYGGSLLLPSIKGDTIAIARKVREQNGQRVIIWNPFNTLGIPGLKFNPLQILVDDVRNNNGEFLQDYSLLIANTLIEKDENDNNVFFRNGAVRLLAGYMIFLAVLRPWQCHLPGLRKLVWSSDKERHQITSIMQKHTGTFGLVAEFGGYLADLFKPEYLKTYGPMRDIATEATLIYKSGTRFGDSLSGSDFTLKDILNENTTFFPIIPEDKLIPFGKSIGLISALLFEEIANLKTPSKLLVLLDEAGNFGHIPNMEKAMTLLPEKGLRVAMAMQSRNQLVELYGENSADNLLKQCSGVQEWSIENEDDAEKWSVRAGNKTIKTHNLTFDPNDPINPWKPSVSETSQPVLNTHQVLTLPKNKQLIKVNGASVIKADLVAYFEVNEWRSSAEENPYHPGGYPAEKPVRFRLNK